MTKFLTTKFPTTMLLTTVFFSLLVFTLASAALADTGETEQGRSTTNNAQLPDPLQAGWEGQRTCEKMFENDTNRILRCTFPPGVGHERHFHLPHFGYALSGGKMRMTDATGSRDLDLVAGTSYFNEGVVWHEGLNIGTTTVQYLIVELK